MEFKDYYDQVAEFVGPTLSNALINYIRESWQNGITIDFCVAQIRKVP